MSDRATAIAIPLVALACCLGLPLAISGGAARLAVVAGAGLPVIILAAVGAWWIARRRTRSGPRVTTAIAAAAPPGGSD